MSNRAQDIRLMKAEDALAFLRDYMRPGTWTEQVAKFGDQFLQPEKDQGEILRRLDELRTLCVRLKERGATVAEIQQALRQKLSQGSSS